MQRIFITLRFTTVLLLLLASTACQAAHVNWLTDVEPALKSANESGRLVLLKFTADWCGYCKKMERETFARPAVADLVNQQFVPVLVDADKYQALVKHLKISGLPAILIVSPEMVILERISGYQTEDKLLPILNTTLAKNQPVAPEPSHVASNPSPTPVRPVSSPKMTADNPFDVSQKVAAPAVYVEPSFGGLCLPGVNETRSLINGQPQFAMNYRGKTLHFSSQQQMQKFHAQPEKYWPMKDGACPVTLADNGQVAEGRLEYAAMFRGKLWFTSSPVQLKKFVASPARYVDAVHGE
jgi:YHS domain-containing protein/thioredoxin-related protein